MATLTDQRLSWPVLGFLRQEDLSAASRSIRLRLSLIRERESTNAQDPSIWSPRFKQIIKFASNSSKACRFVFEVSFFKVRSSIFVH